MTFLFYGISGNANFSFTVSYAFFYLVDFFGSSRFVFRSSPKFMFFKRYFLYVVGFLAIGNFVFDLILPYVEDPAPTSVLVGVLLFPFRVLVSSYWVYGSNDFLLTAIRYSGIFSRYCTSKFAFIRKSNLERSKSESMPVTWVRSLLGFQNAQVLIDLDLAWWPFVAQDRVESYLSKRDNPQVFEWGSGASSVWLSKRSHRVVTVEHDEDWALQMRQVASRYKLRNLEIVHVEALRSVSPKISSGKIGYEGLDFTRYVNSIEAYENFDLIVIDGRARIDCLIVALKHLKPSGVILLDDSNRKRYRSRLPLLPESTLRGLGPASLWVSQSSLISPLG
jgi:precorrin-6B methylase 2